MPNDAVSPRHVLTAATADVCAVVIFVVLGRRNHSEPVASWSTGAVVAPFLIGLVVGWLAARAWRAPMRPRVALVVWPCTVAVGMVVRDTVFARSSAFAFVVVATVVLGIELVGWRGVARLVERRRQARFASQAQG